MAIIPGKHMAFAVMINSEDGGALLAVFHHLLDRYPDAPSTDWIARYREVVDQRQAAALKALKTQHANMHSSAARRCHWMPTRAPIVIRGTAP